MIIGPHWSDTDVALLRREYLRGQSDYRIGKLLNRSGKSVEAKRKVLNLTTKYYPQRRRPQGDRGGGRQYSKQDETAILTRYHNGEPVRDIADSYNVSRRAIENKIERLLDLQRHPVLEFTPRRCLCCGKQFMSRQPKSNNRRCRLCASALRESGASFETVYDCVVVHL